ncbi:iron-sulfur cluster biosynthesis family protein [Vagococcus vulneris]|nr:iron-sulfur cluster biosynthesis family protein [Vagococcus vulneris]
MRLTISDDVLKVVPELKKGFVLTLNDGSNDFSSAQGCCMIGERCLLIPTDSLIEPFNIVVNSNVSKVWISKYDTMFINGNMTLDINPTAKTIMLRNDGGIIDSNVTVYKETATKVN